MVSAVQFRPWPPASDARFMRRLSEAPSAKADRPLLLQPLHHPKHRLARCGQLALAVFHHRIEQLAFHLRQRPADGGNRPGPALAVEHELRATSPDCIECPGELPLKVVPFSHRVCCPPRPMRRSTDTCVVYSSQSRPYPQLTQP